MARKSNDPAPAEVEYVTIFADILQETPSAILINSEGEECWLAKSQIEYEGERGDEGVEISVPEWLANEKGLSDGQGYKAPVGDPQTEGMPDAEDAAADTEGQDAADEPAPQVAEAFTFKADVIRVKDATYELSVEAPESGETLHFIFDRDEVEFDGQEHTELQVGYRHMHFTVSWGVAESTGLLSHLGVEAPDTAPAEEAPQDDDGDEQPHVAPYRRKLREELITVPITLNPEEREAVGQRMADAIERKEELEDDLDSYRKTINAQIKEAEKEFREASKLWNKGREEREISCDVIGDYNTGELVWCEKSWPYREVKRQRMTEKDRQLPLPIETSPAPVTESAADPTNEVPAEDQGPHAEPDTVTLYGSLLDEDETAFKFLVTYEDETEAEFTIPRDQVTAFTFENPDDPTDEITIYRVFALEAGIIEDETPEEAPEQDRSCGTCGRIHETPEGDEDDPCRECQPEDFPNWRPLAVIPKAAPEAQAGAEV